NRFALRQVLRDEWKFDGMVVTDYEAINEMIQHGYALDPRDAALKAARAGVDMEMVSTTYFDHLKSLVQAGQLEMKSIDTSVRNILRLKFRLGLFDENTRTPASALPTAPARDLAKRLAAESI